jgi:glycosyltransferase involved in cell wall biosynthesis
VTRFICNSQFSLDALLAHGIDARKAALIRGVPSRRLPGRAAGARDPRRIIFVGQVIPPKGVHVLLEALALMAKRGIDARLDIVGHVEGWLAPEYGNYWSELEDRAQAPDLVGRVRFLGWREDVDALLREAAVHCCPSLPEIRESFAGVVLEAQAAGLPSVVFPTGGLPEAVTHGVNGWVCAGTSAEDLAEGLEHFLRDDERRLRAGEAASRARGAAARSAFAAEWWSVFSHAPARTRPLQEKRSPA